MKAHQQNLIGKHVTINNKTGTVQDETKNTIIMDDGKTYEKKTSTITIGTQTIKGEEIQKTPEERIKVHKK